VVLVPFLAGYRYTLDRSGTGWYVEPNAGYAFGATDMQVIDSIGDPSDVKLSGALAGATVGYLFEPSGRIQFNIGLRYEHIFGSVGQNMFSLRISHAFSFRRNE
jgi:hypothetical protein